MSNGRIYVGNLPMDVQRRDLEDLFSKYGKIRDIELKNYRGSAPFAFVQFEDPRDADDAVCGRNGCGYGESKLRVEYPRVSSGQFGPAGGGRGGGEGRGGGGGRGRGGPPTRRSDFRVIVTDVQRSGEGIVEFIRREDMEYALRRLDRTEFRSHQGETAFIRVYEDRSCPSWERSRSRSRSRGRYSPPYSRGSPPPRYPSPPRYAMSRRSPPPRRYSGPQYSPPPRHYR